MSGTFLVSSSDRGIDRFVLFTVIVDCSPLLTDDRSKIFGLGLCDRSLKNVFCSYLVHPQNAS